MLSELVNRVCDVTARHCGVTAVELKTRDCERRVTTPRHIAWYVMRSVAGADGLSYPKIAAQFDMHHTAVMHGARQIDAGIIGDGTVSLWVGERPPNKVRLRELVDKIEHEVRVADCSEIGSGETRTERSGQCSQS